MILQSVNGLDGDSGCLYLALLMSMSDSNYSSSNGPYVRVPTKAIKILVCVYFYYILSYPQLQYPPVDKCAPKLSPDSSAGIVMVNHTNELNNPIYCYFVWFIRSGLNGRTAVLLFRLPPHYRLSDVYDFRKSLKIVSAGSRQQRNL